MPTPNVRVMIAMLLIISLTSAVRGDDAVPNDPPLRWWKGNIHTHSLWSDGNDFPEMIAEWYRSRDYNFLALSDHNIMSEGMRWMKLSAIEKRGGDQVLPKYETRFGGGWVEIRGAGDEREIRLKPLDEFRNLVEDRGKFIMIPGEEITDSVKGKPVHMNATNLTALIQPLSGETVGAAMEANLRAAEDQAKRTGREILVHLNHPNFHYAITAEEIAHVVTERFFEVYNGHPGVNHLGDKDHPSIERMWDIANTIRLGGLEAPVLYGVATDDSHVYHGKQGSRPGRGWVMVQSRYLTPEHLVRAMKAGRFYCSSGVSLTSVEFDATSGNVKLAIDAKPGVQYTTQFIGTKKNFDGTSTPRLDKDGKEINATRLYSADVGAVLATSKELAPSYQLQGDELFVRAVVTSSESPADPSHRDQLQQAWTQPFVPKPTR
ncbi:MAG: hypothetical protein KDB14_29145 [Planctomycetales bacterium]|nr:hypothetical protein [Planctomycetales bacterium]